MMRIVLFSVGDSFTTAIESLDLDLASAHVSVVSATAAHPDERVKSIVLGPRALSPQGRLDTFFERSPAGRNLRRLTPFDGGRRYASAVRRNPGVREAAQDANLLVALERDTALAAWIALHRWAPASGHGVYGIAPARALLASRHLG